MYRRVTTLLALIVMLVGTSEALAQTEVTIREINAIPQNAIDAVEARGIDLSEQEIIDNIRSPFTDESVTFTAVVLSAPQNSGLSSYNESRNGPSRVHYFVRDTSAVSLGNEGMVIQIVDGNWDQTGTIDLFKGDVVTMTGDVSYFGTGIQFSPESISYQGTYQSLGLPDTIMDPVTVTIDQLNKFVGDSDEQSQANWVNFSDLNQQFVRIENVEVFQSPNRFDDRPGFVLRDKTTGQVIQNDDISLRYRNDQSQQPDPPFNVLEDDFVAPPVGATVNIEGFALLRSSFDIGDNFTPNAGFLSITPWEDDDLEVTASPPNISNISSLNAIITTSTGASFTADVDADPSRTLTDVEAVYYTSSDATELTVDGVLQSGSTYSFDLPAGTTNEEFFIYRVRATDSEGAVSESTDTPTRVLNDGVTKITHIQETFDGSPGDSPFAGATLTTDITATVTMGGDTGVLALQDDETGAPWSGIVLESVNGDGDVAGLVDLRPGDVINITQATIEEDFGLTKIDEEDIVFSVVSTGGSTIDPVVVPTGALQDASVAEAHEGMLLEFDAPFVAVTQTDVAIGGPYGEFTISTDGSEDDDIRVDDLSSFVSYEGGDPGTMFNVGDQLEFVRGVLWYTFSNYKLQPATFDDIGPVIDTAIEDEVLPAAFALKQNYPNPFNPSTKIEFDVTSAGVATLDVFDVLGRKVRTLVDGQMTVGTQSVTFDAGTLPSGVYIYRLSAGDNVQTRKMLLMK